MILLLILLGAVGEMVLRGEKSIVNGLLRDFKEAVS